MCRGSLTSSSLQPEQVKPSAQNAVTDPIIRLVEAEFCMVSPCGDPKIFHGGVVFPSKNSCYKGPLLFFFPSSGFLLVLCSFSYLLLQPFLPRFLICSVQCTLSSNNRIIRKSCRALKNSI